MSLVEVDVTTISHKDFWKLPEVVADKSLRELYAAISSRLQTEAPGADMLELMMMERVCFFYVFLRTYEKVGDDGKLTFDRNYKDMLSLWLSMAADLRKQRMHADEMQTVRAAIVAEVATALKEAMKELDPNVAQVVQSQLLALVA